MAQAVKRNIFRRFFDRTKRVANFAFVGAGVGAVVSVFFLPIIPITIGVSVGFLGAGALGVKEKK